MCACVRLICAPACWCWHRHHVVSCRVATARERDTRVNTVTDVYATEPHHSPCILSDSSETVGVVKRVGSDQDNNGLCLERSDDTTTYAYSRCCM
jgi:hypothetical protein